MEPRPQIHFYIPKRDLPNGPAEPEALLAAGPTRHVTAGVLGWTVLTCQRLRARGIPCTLGSERPRNAILLGHCRSLPPRFSPGPDQLLVSIRADSHAHPFAQLQVVQNPLQATGRCNVWIPSWTQPGLVPRDARREDQIRTVAYFGEPENLHPDFRTTAWEDALRERGLEWALRGQGAWHDFRDVDVVVAFRPGNPAHQRHKPATKLINAWLAGVAAILPPEPAYVAMRETEHDYLEASDATSALACIDRLCRDAGLYRAMREQGAVRGAAFSPEATTDRWAAFLEDHAIPAWRTWCALPGWRQRLWRMGRRLPRWNPPTRP